MDSKKLFFVEHRITDKKGWESVISKWSDLLASDEMNLDKGLKHPALEGFVGILSCVDTTGENAFGITETASHVTLAEYQDFMENLTCGYCINKCFDVEHGEGLKDLDTRGYMRSFINRARGMTPPGYLDAPKLWYSRHHIKDVEGWNRIFGEMIDNIGKTCETPSDFKEAVFEKGFGSPLSLTLGERDAICLWGSPASTTHEEFQKMIDSVTKGTCKNENFLIDPAKSYNLEHLAEDNRNADLLAFAKSKVKTVNAEENDAGVAKGAPIIFTQ